MATSKIEAIINEMEDYIDSCKPKMFSTNEIVVGRDEMGSLIRRLRENLPEEIEKYQNVISRREEILQEARNKADVLMQNATTKTNELISEHSIMREAYAQAEEVVNLANGQAQAMLDSAVAEANRYNTSAVQYTDSMLAEIQDILQNSIQSATTNYNNFINGLTQYYETVIENRNALRASQEEDTTDSEGEEPAAEGTDGEDAEELTIM